MILHFCYVQLVLQLRNSDLHLLQLAPRFLLMLALAAAILQPRFAQFFKTLCPNANLLIADLIFSGDVAVIPSRCDTLYGDLDALFLRCISCFAHETSS